MCIKVKWVQLALFHIHETLENSTALMKEALECKEDKQHSEQLDRCARIQSREAVYLFWSLREHMSFIELDDTNIDEDSLWHSIAEAAGYFKEIKE